jgi:hypothetical protein
MRTSATLCAVFFARAEGALQSPQYTCGLALWRSIPINPITSLIAEYAEALHANQDRLVTRARTVTDMFLRIEQIYYHAVTAPFDSTVDGARTAVAMAELALRAAKVVVDRTLNLANATPQEEMHIRTHHRALDAENLHVLIQEYVHDSKQFASHSENQPVDSFGQKQAANAAQYFMHQAMVLALTTYMIGSSPPVPTVGDTAII